MLQTVTYEEINQQDKLCTLNELNSMNYIAATKTISNALFILLDENKENYFEHYPDPKAYIEA
jgi:hypothetical protein